jgi:sugar phosphate isomerase/epimerase
MRILSLAAATAPAPNRTELIHNAAAATFDAVGLRLDLDPPTRAELRSIRSALDSTGLVLLDVEVVRIGTHDAVTIAGVIEAAGELGARHLLAVSDLDDDSATTAVLAELGEQAQAAGMRVVVEFMRFTGIRTLKQAFEVVEATGDPSIGVLVDPLHLARSGGHPTQLAAFDPLRLAYIQLCDAPTCAPAGGVDALIEEARHSRLLPGSGELPLDDLLQAVPFVPISVEVHNDGARSRYSPAELAKVVADHTRSRFGHKLR